MATILEQNLLPGSYLTTSSETHAAELIYGVPVIFGLAIIFKEEEEVGKEIRL